MLVRQGKREQYRFKKDCSLMQVHKFYLGPLHKLKFSLFFCFQVIGRLELGGDKCTGTALHHWNEVLSSPRRQIAEWHKLREQARHEAGVQSTKQNTKQTFWHFFLSLSVWKKMIWDKFKGLEKLIRQIVALVELRIPRRPPAGLGQLIEVLSYFRPGWLYYVTQIKVVF